MKEIELPNKITSKFVKENFNIENEKKIITYNKKIGYIDIENNIPNNDNKFSKTNFLQIVNKELDKFPENSFISLEYYGYDGAFEIAVYITEKRKENDKEVLNRLLNELRKEKRLRNKIQNAIQTLDENIERIS